MRILGIETSCDETGIAVFDTLQQRVISNALYSQIDLHKQFGGVLPEVASRSQLDKINEVMQQALAQADITLDDIDVIAVTTHPGLIGSLLVGVCFAKALAWATSKKIIGVNHLEGHIASGFLDSNGTVRNIPFPHLNLTASGGHTALYVVHGFGSFELIAQTTDDAAGEALDKVAKMMDLGYPGGPVIEKLAEKHSFVDTLHFPRTKLKNNLPFFSFSGLKTAVLYYLVSQGAYDLQAGNTIADQCSDELKQQVASSLLSSIADIFILNIKAAFSLYPNAQALTFGGGVACNRYLCTRLQKACTARNKLFFAPPPKFCTDNGSMIAFVGSYKATQGNFDNFALDVKR